MAVFLPKCHALLTRGSRDKMRGVVETPEVSKEYAVNLMVAPESAASTIVFREAAIENLQCVPIQNGVVFSMTFREHITYIRSVDGAVLTQAFEIPFTDMLPTAEITPGMTCDIKADLSGVSVELKSPISMANIFSFKVSVTASPAEGRRAACGTFTAAVS